MLVTSVVQRDVPIYRDWVALLNCSVNAQISPKVSGYITKRNYQEGYFVTKGQTTHFAATGPASKLHEIVTPKRRDLIA